MPKEIKIKLGGHGEHRAHCKKGDRLYNLKRAALTSGHASNAGNPHRRVRTIPNAPPPMR